MPCSLAPISPPPTPTSRRVIMAGSRRRSDLRRARRRGQPAGTAAARRRPAAGRPRRPLHGEPPALPRASLWGATTPGSYYTAHELRGCTSRRAGLHPRRLRRAGVHHLAATRPTRPPRSSTDTPGVELRLMLDGTVDGYDALRGRGRRPAGRAARRARRGRRTCSTAPAPPASPKGVKCRCPARRWATAPIGVTSLCQLLFGVDERHGLPLARRRCTTPPRCASAWPPTRSAAPSW